MLRAGSGAEELGGETSAWPTVEARRLASPCDGTGRGEDQAGAWIISGRQHGRRAKRQRAETVAELELLGSKPNKGVLVYFCFRADSRHWTLWPVRQRWAKSGHRDLRPFGGRASVGIN